MSITKTFFNVWYRVKPPPMVSYWKEGKGMLGRTRIAKEGHFEMEIKGEKYPLKGFPRGFLMVSEKGDYPLFSKVKHEAKNLIFNWAWEQLENGADEKVIISDIKGHALDVVFDMFSGLKYYQLPFDRLVPAAKEFYRAMMTLENESTRVRPLKDFLSFTMQEDDAYRYRVQWLFEASRIKRGDSIEQIRLKLEQGFRKLENAEVTDDMKARIRLLSRVVLMLLRDKKIGILAQKLFKEIDVKKMYLDKADKYHFRAKYFKVDHARYSY